MNPRFDTVLRRWPWPAAVLAVAIWGAVLGANGRGVDFRVYWTAAGRFLQGVALYQEGDGHLPFKYAPATAWLFVPLAWLPLKLAAALWNTGSVLAFWRASAMIVAEPWQRALALAALAQCLYFELFYGQVDLMMLALLLAAAAWSRGDRPWLAGAALALAVLLKPPAAVFGLLLLRERRWHALAAAAALGLLLWLPIALRYGGETPTLIDAWLETLARTTPPWVLGHNPQGLPTLLLTPFFYGEIPNTTAIAVAQLTGLALFAALIWLLPLPASTQLALCCFAAAFCSPLAWRANFVLAWPLAVESLRVARAANTGPWRMLGPGAVALLALVGAAINEGTLSQARFIAVMEYRPFALAFATLMVITVLGARQRAPE